MSGWSEKALILDNKSITGGHYGFRKARIDAEGDASWVLFL